MVIYFLGGAAYSDLSFAFLSIFLSFFMKEDGEAKSY